MDAAYIYFYHGMFLFLHLFWFKVLLGILVHRVCRTSVQARLSFFLATSKILSFFGTFSVFVIMLYGEFLFFFSFFDILYVSCIFIGNYFFRLEKYSIIFIANIFCAFGMCFFSCLYSHTGIWCVFGFC